MDNIPNSTTLAAADVAAVSESVQGAEAARAHQDDVVRGLPASENKKFYPALDGLRAVAVLMVFYQHYFFHPLALRWGWTGVNIFFVLSGFLITGILYDTRDTAHRFRNFYVRRTLRIFPLYYGVLLAALLLTPFFRWVWHPAFFMWPLYLGNYSRYIWNHDWLVNGPAIDHLVSGVPGRWPSMLYFGHFWSLCVEEQFYLGWPLVVFLVKDRVKLRNLCVGAFVGCLIGRIVCQHLLPGDWVGGGFLERFTLLRVDSLLLGGFLALTLRGPEAARVARWAKPTMLLTVAAFGGMEMFYLATTHRPFMFQPEAWLQTVGFSVLDLFAATLILFTIEPGTIAFRVLSHRWLRRLGQISYGFYVFHDIPHRFYEHIGMAILGTSSRYLQYLNPVIALMGTLLLSYLSFRFFESPFLRLKERFTVSE